MPKVSTNYQNNLIYKIQHKTIDELIYIGSTTNFNQRKYKHKYDCNNEKHKSYNTKIYVMIRENGGWEAFDMVLVKKYSCNDYLEAHAEEERIRRELNANMNSIRCFRTEEEYKEYNKIQAKQYRETHKEKVEAHKKKKVECECGCILLKNGLPRHKRSHNHLKLLNEKVEKV